MKRFALTGSSTSFLAILVASMTLCVPLRAEETGKSYTTKDGTRYFLVGTTLHCKQPHNEMSGSWERVKDFAFDDNGTLHILHTDGLLQRFSGGNWTDLGKKVKKFHLTKYGRSWFLIGDHLRYAELGGAASRPIYAGTRDFAFDLQGRLILLSNSGRLERLDGGRWQSLTSDSQLASATIELPKLPDDDYRPIDPMDFELDPDVRESTPLVPEGSDGDRRQQAIRNKELLVTLALKLHVLAGTESSDDDPYVVVGGVEYPRTKKHWTLRGSAAAGKKVRGEIGYYYLRPGKRLVIPVEVRDADDGLTTGNDDTIGSFSLHLANHDGVLTVITLPGDDAVKLADRDFQLSGSNTDYRVKVLVNTQTKSAK